MSHHALHYLEQGVVNEWFNAIQSFHPDIQGFPSIPPEGDRTHTLLAETDRQLTRDWENLITLLAERNIIHPTDLPPEIQKKLLLRRQLRSKSATTAKF